MRILYVEDNAANLFLVQRVARMGSHEVITYTNGEVALENFRRDNPDLVLMDVQLPGKLTGLDVVRALRASGHKTPMIAVTAYAMVGDRERCLEAGCDGYIAKPMPVNELVALFERYANKANPAKVVETPTISSTVSATETPTLPTPPVISGQGVTQTEAAPTSGASIAPLSSTPSKNGNGQTAPLSDQKPGSNLPSASSPSVN